MSSDLSGAAQVRLPKSVCPPAKMENIGPYIALCSASKGPLYLALYGALKGPE